MARAGVPSTVEAPYKSSFSLIQHQDFFLSIELSHLGGIKRTTEQSHFNHLYPSSILITRKSLPVSKETHQLDALLHILIMYSLC